jgi:signal transduction histidine kinase
MAAAHDDEPVLQLVTSQTADPATFLTRVKYLYEHRQEKSHEEILLKDGRVIDRHTAPMISAEGQDYGRVWFFRDITGRKQLEEQLFQARKMETVGKLAGGVAHEFNSLLTAIIGQSELLVADLPAGSPLMENATEIIQAAHRAATLTRQLLAYGRQQFLRAKPLDLNRVLAGMDGGLRELLAGKAVDLNLVPAPGLHLVQADASQIEQVVINLVTNACEAMPKGGQLTLETANVTLGQDFASRFPELKPGDYVRLAVTDTGAGMSTEVQVHAFEPFFTTKDIGQGTGLGLSTCHGIIKQSGGHIRVVSEVGRGTTCEIYLPRLADSSESKSFPSSPLAQTLRTRLDQPPR